MDRVMNGQGDCCIYPDNIIFNNPTCSRSLWSQHTKINCSSWIAVEKVVQAIKGIVSGMLYGSLKYIVILGALNYGNSSESSWLFTSSQRIHTFFSNLQNKTIPSQAHYVQPRISNPPFSSGLKPTLLMTAISFYFLYFVCRGSYVHMYYVAILVSNVHMKIRRQFAGVILLLSCGSQGLNSGPWIWHPQSGYQAISQANDLILTVEVLLIDFVPCATQILSGAEETGPRSLQHLKFIVC